MTWHKPGRWKMHLTSSFFLSFSRGHLFLWLILLPNFSNFAVCFYWPNRFCDLLHISSSHSVSAFYLLQTSKCTKHLHLCILPFGNRQRREIKFYCLYKRWLKHVKYMADDYCLPSNISCKFKISFSSSFAVFLGWCDCFKIFLCLFVRLVFGNTRPSLFLFRLIKVIHLAKGVNGIINAYKWCIFNRK